MQVVAITDPSGKLYDFKRLEGAIDLLTEAVNRLTFLTELKGDG
jgi:hypothetical protein